MIPSIEETSEESFEREKRETEKRAEGWDEGQPRHVNDPDKPAGVKDHITDHHGEQNFLQESDPQTSACVPRAPSPSPPSMAEQTHRQKSLKRCASSAPPQDCPTSVKKSHASTEHSELTDPSGDTASHKKWFFLLYKCSNTETLETIEENSILKCTLDVLDKSQLNFSNRLSNTFSLNDFMQSKFEQILQRYTYKIDPKKISVQYAILICVGETYFEKELIFANNGEHSEDHITKILEDMKQTKEIYQYSEIWIYTTNNPCIMRENHEPCMSKLIFLSIQLSQEHGIKMYIGFTKCYIFKTKMKAIFKKSKDFGDCSKKIMEAFELVHKLKFPVKLNTRKINQLVRNILKRFTKSIPQDKRKDCVQIKLPQSPDLSQTYKEWNETVKNLIEKLVLKMREIIGESVTADYDEVKAKIEKLMLKKVNSDMLLNQDVGNLIKEQVVLYYLEVNQGLEHHPVFFWVDSAVLEKYCISSNEE
ncbi:uncharacterized protein LOC132897468 [Neoarius graeffei]|uniref:uncharacterized protein LOC132897468 n=1 Tax=Neoarius graeffei TaxID=443677 RepID=UPI00298C8916|nr:uncharacterized protein LOC132897468 [Neoarius graeffei]